MQSEESTVRNVQEYRSASLGITAQSRAGIETKVKRRPIMFTGTLIDELISTVERAETHAHRNDSHDPQSPYWYTATEGERALDSKFLGVA